VRVEFRDSGTREMGTELAGKLAEDGMPERGQRSDMLISESVTISNKSEWCVPGSNPRRSCFILRNDEELLLYETKTSCTSL
jgi:hypothetical protein